MEYSSEPLYTTELQQQQQQQQQQQPIMDFNQSSAIAKPESEEDLFQYFFPQEDVFSHPVETSEINSMDDMPDFFSSLENLNLNVKPDPDAHLLQMPPPLQSSQLVEPDTKKKRALAKSASGANPLQPALKKPRSEQSDERHERKPKTRDPKYLKRLQANKKSAQASRERKKQLRVEQQVQNISQDNAKLRDEIHALETENKVLKGEFIQLQNLIADSAILSKLMARQTSMQLAMVDDERMRLEEKLKQELMGTPSVSTAANVAAKLDSSNVVAPNLAAFMYLLIVMQSFGQHFNNLNLPKIAAQQSASVMPLERIAPLEVM